MNIINLKVNRMIIHQVFQRNGDGKVVPELTHELIEFQEAAQENFKNRVIGALGKDSKAVEMIISSQDSETSLPKIIDKMIDVGDEEYVSYSHEIAQKLTDSQHSRGISGGIVVVFSGTQGPANKKFIGIIKAEIHTGYEKHVDPKTRKIGLKYIEEILLTPSTRLYKTVGFFEKAGVNANSQDLNDKWTVLISDSQITQAEGKAAARYFYEGFLGLGYPISSERTTKSFYEYSTAYIDALDIDQSKKSDLFNALSTYLLVDNSSVISSNEFAGKYLDIELQDIFVEYMCDKGIPGESFIKDTKLILQKLKFRKISFSKNIKITAPFEVFNNLVEIKTDNYTEADGSTVERTILTIKDRITNQQ